MKFVGWKRGYAENEDDPMYPELKSVPQVREIQIECSLFNAKLYEALLNTMRKVGSGIRKISFKGDIS